MISREVSDGIIAGSYTSTALEILKKKKNGKFIILEGNRDFEYQDIEFRELNGFGLSQRANNQVLSKTELDNIVTQNVNMTEEIKDDLILATITLKYTPSNSITISHNGIVLGVELDNRIG